MTKNYFLAIVAGLAILMAGCGKTDTPTPDPGKDKTTDTDPSGTDEKDPEKQDDGKITSADFAGSWGQGEDTDMLVLKEDGSFAQKEWDETISGKWSFNEKDNTITFTPDGSEAWTKEVLLIGGKAWLVLMEESDGFRSVESYRKAGAKVESGTLGDGRWDAPHSGVKPAQYTEDADYRLCLLVSGKNIDLYVPMWGYHIQGTFTLNDGKMHIEADDNHIWAAKYINYVDSYNWSFGWEAWGDGPDAGPAMNPETFELNGVYTWYTVNELKKMGHEPKDDDDHSFEAVIWNAGQQLHDEAMDLCNFELCVSPDGKEAYGVGIGLSPWFYKR